ncbi:unnamed protein product [Ectocarpus sp. CCAP 1310/34]|nr:unnamed protein product [Ectocarpus sp. CCAP 1310/34]
MLKAARKKRSIARWKALETFFEGYVRQLEKKSREGDQAGFYRHLKMIDVEGKRSFTSRNIKDEDGRVLRDPTFIRQRWAWWFHKLLNTKSPTIDLHAADRSSGGLRTCHSTTSHLYLRLRKRCGKWPTERPSGRTTYRLS